VGVDDENTYGSHILRQPAVANFVKPLEQQPLLLQERANRGKNPLRQLMLLEHVPKAQDRRLVENIVVCCIVISAPPLLPIAHSIGHSTPPSQSFR
jgi:hypothetical protein